MLEGPDLFSEAPTSDSDLIPDPTVTEIIEYAQKAAEVIAIDRRPRCCDVSCVKRGLDRYKCQKWQCRKCKRLFTRTNVPRGLLRIAGNNTLPDVKVLIVFRLLVEGMSIRAISRVTRVHKKTILNLIEFAGPLCARLMEAKFSGLRVSDIEVDETWTYVFKKEFNKKECEKKSHQVGSKWIYIALDRASRSVLTWHVGRRTLDDADRFMRRVRKVTDGFFTVHTDGFQPYPTAIYTNLLGGGNVSILDYLEGPAAGLRNDGTIGMLHSADGFEYSRSLTNRVERFNGTIRSHLARMRRSTNAFSKSVAMLECHIALFVCYYNFCLKNIGIDGASPAMAVGITDHVWDMKELILRMQEDADYSYVYELPSPRTSDKECVSA